MVADGAILNISYSDIRGGLEWIFGDVVNMGAYGGTVEASNSYFGEPPCRTIVTGA
ncbi:MAG: hypothetical protein J7M40_05090 [Planctomycetes bacterium]|nr:hypothetical protein [Planctomycetota bacterium]